MSIRPELWDFPHRMTLKVMGESCHDLRQLVLAELRERNIEHEPATCNEKMSGKGNYLSISVVITVQNREEVETLYLALNARPEVKIVL